jgi:hypothetical protein
MQDRIMPISPSSQCCHHNWPDQCTWCISANTPPAGCIYDDHYCGICHRQRWQHDHMQAIVGPEYRHAFIPALRSIKQVIRDAWSE